MSDTTIVIMLFFGAVVGLPLIMALSGMLYEQQETFADILKKWLSPKIVLTALAASFLCWQAYKARCAYEDRCRSATAAYERMK